MAQNKFPNFGVYGLLVSHCKTFEENVGFEDKLPTGLQKRRIQMTSEFSIELIDLMLRSQFPHRTNGAEENSAIGPNSSWQEDKKMTYLEGDRFSAPSKRADPDGSTTYE